MKVYLDTSVFSAYYDQRNSVRMEMTKEFWIGIEKYDKLCSDLVLKELNQATSELAPKLVALTKDFKIIQIDDSMKTLAQVYVQAGVVASGYFADALHIAAAVLGEADILVSWNFRHLVKRSTRFLVNYINTQQGLPNIEILAPPEV